PNIIQVNPSALHVFPCLPLRRTKAGMNEQFDKGSALSRKFLPRNITCRRFTKDFVEGRLGNPGNIASKEDFACAYGFGGCAGAMDQIGDGVSERPVRPA